MARTRYLARTELGTGKRLVLIRETIDEGTYELARFDIDKATWVQDANLIYISGIGGAADVEDISRSQARRWLGSRDFDPALLTATAT